MALKPQFEVVPDDEPLLTATDDGAKALDVLLAIFSQKTGAALSGFYSLLTVLSVFWLSFVIIPHDPSVQQLVGLGGYAAFVIAVNVIVRKR
jgi:hypothetical protein